MMRKVVSLTAFLMLAVLSCLTAPAVYADEPPQPYLKKTIERDETVPNLYNATIETFVEGIRQSVETYEPIDVMLILEFSQKTSENCGGSNLAASIENLINSLKTMPDVNLSIVSFRKDSATLQKALGNVNDYDFSTLKATISNDKSDIYGSSWCLPIYGLNLANNNFAKNPNRKQYCIHVQFGKIYYAGGEYDEAEKAWQKAYDIKQKGIKIYTVFVGSAKYDETFNDGTRYMTTHHALEGISSDYYDAYWNLCTSSKITNIPSYWKGYATRRPSKSEPYLSKDNHEYHFKVDAGSTMFAGVLSDIQADAAKTEYIIVPSISLTSPSVVDKLATGFKLPNGASATCKVAPCTGKTDGKFTWGSETDAAGVTASAANSTVTVSGFNFNDNCVYSDGSSTNVGKKLIVRYPFIIDTSTDISGIGIKTTDDSSSGIFDGGNKKGTFDTSDAKADLVTITVTVTGLREGDNAVVNLTKSGSTKSLRYVVVGDADGRGTIDVNFQEPNKSYTASVELSRIYNKVDSQTETLSGNHTFNFACTPNFEVNVSHAEAHYQIEY